MNLCGGHPIGQGPAFITPYPKNHFLQGINPAFLVQLPVHESVDMGSRGIFNTFFNSQLQPLMDRNDEI